MLNKKAFILLAGNPDVWDNEMARRTLNGESLLTVQVDQFSRGRRQAELTRSLTGWCVISASSLDGHKILFLPKQTPDTIKDAGFREAWHWGFDWIKQYPFYREIFARKATLLDFPKEVDVVILEQLRAEHRNDA